VVRIAADTFADLGVGALHVGTLAVDVLAAQPEELVVVGRFEMVPARAPDARHGAFFGQGSDGQLGGGPEPERHR
jgi:hypothetical protein